MINVQIKLGVYLYAGDICKSACVQWALHVDEKELIASELVINNSALISTVGLSLDNNYQLLLLLSSFYTRLRCFCFPYSDPFG